MTLEQFVTVVQALTTLVVAVIAVVAWIAKIRWSQEFARAKDEVIRAKEAEISVWKSQTETLSRAKDEVIRAKEAEIETLSKISPTTLRDYLVHTRELIEAAAKAERSHLEQRIGELEASIAQEREKSAGESRKVAELLEERARLQERDTQLATFTTNYESLLRSAVVNLDPALYAWMPTASLVSGAVTAAAIATIANKRQRAKGTANKSKEKEVPPAPAQPPSR